MIKPNRYHKYTRYTDFDAQQKKRRKRLQGTVGDITQESEWRNKGHNEEAIQWLKEERRRLQNVTPAQREQWRKDWREARARDDRSNLFGLHWMREDRLKQSRDTA